MDLGDVGQEHGGFPVLQGVFAQPQREAVVPLGPDHGLLPGQVTLDEAVDVDVLQGGGAYAQVVEGRPVGKDHAAVVFGQHDTGGQHLEDLAEAVRIHGTHIANASQNIQRNLTCM